MNALLVQAAALADYFASGGVVMWPLAGISIWAWTLVLLKGRQFAIWRRGETRAEEVIQQALAAHAAKAAPCDGRCQPGRSSADMTATGNWQSTLACAFLRRRSGDPALDAQLLHRLSHRYGHEAGQGVSTILIFAATAPLLGLLGTVTGMINAFEALAAWGSAHPRALSSGISEALVSTQTGLLVAIPVLFAGQFLRRRAQTFQARVDRFCAALGRAARNAPRESNGPATDTAEGA